MNPKLTHIQITKRCKVEYWTDFLRAFFDEAYKHDPKKFDSTFNSMAFPERKKLGIYKASEEEEMSHLLGKKPEPIAGSNFYVYASKLNSKGGRLVEVRDRCRKVQDLLGWPEDSVQAFSEDQLLWPDD